MQIIISPAKKMNVDTDSLPCRGLPAFLPRTERLLAALRAMDSAALKRLWKCNDQIAALNLQRLASMDLRRNLTPALLSYEGIQYQYMAPAVFTDGEYDYVQAHLRILSGFYGLLRPFDGVVPYRLEMQARLPVDGHRDLYGFWGDKPARALAGETDLLVNLASAEYSRAVKPHLPPRVRFLTCTFGEWKEGRVIEKGTLCKMARGRMVRWLAENNVTAAGDIREFRELGYRYNAGCSGENHYVFIKEDG